MCSINGKRRAEPHQGNSDSPVPGRAGILCLDESVEIVELALTCASAQVTGPPEAANIYVFRMRDLTSVRKRWLWNFAAVEAATRLALASGQETEGRAENGSKKRAEWT